MAGSGGPTPKGKQIKEALVIKKGETLVTFEMEVDDVEYFEVGKTYQLIAIDKE